MDQVAVVPADAPPYRPNSNHSSLNHCPTVHDIEDAGQSIAGSEHPAMCEGSPHRASLSAHNALYRSILSAYGKGLADGGALALFALDCPDDATKALEAYQCQEQRVLDAAQAFLLSENTSSAALEREMEALCRLRGSRSRPASGIKDARGSHRRKR